MSKVLVYKNGFIKRKIVRFLVVAVFATVFLGCKKDIDSVESVKIANISVTEIKSTTAVFTIILEMEGDVWWLDDVGAEIAGVNGENITMSWQEYNDGQNSKKYVAHIAGLTAGENYAVRAYLKASYDASHDMPFYSDFLYFTTERN